MTTVENIFNNMAEYYDDLTDLWHSWFFCRIHSLITSYVIGNRIPRYVLDVGCGTGLQSYLHAASGSEVYGIDISKKLIEIAEKKKEFFDPQKFEFFPAYFDYVRQYNNLIKSIIKKKVGHVVYKPPNFQIADATKIPFDNNKFDHVNCCGSVLSFIPNHKKALLEISRVLKKGGTFFIDVEARWNLDSLWFILDPLFGNKLDFNNDIRTSLKMLKNILCEVWVDFPFREGEKDIKMTCKLFTNHTLKQDLIKYGLRVEKKWSVHSVTNLIPSRILDHQKPSNRLTKLFFFLANIEKRLPFFVPGSSLAYYGTKVQ
jgi:ubiquinone/menaquinone biosynthesis C-methylase UbiE